MAVKTSIKPITYLKNHAAELIQEVSEHHRSVVVTQNGVAKAVLMDVETFDAWQDSVAMLKLVSLSEEDIREGRVHDQADVFADAHELLDELDP
jgi:prevent-host-death family protein